MPTTGPTWAYFFNTYIHLCSLSEDRRLTRREAESERFLLTGLSISVSLSSTPWSLTNSEGPHSEAGSLLETIAHTHDKGTHTHSPSSSVRHTLHLRRVYKTFNCELFYAGDNPWAYLHSEDIFCGQLEDESQRRRNNGTGEEKGENKIQICLVKGTTVRQFCDAACVFMSVVIWY